VHLTNHEIWAIAHGLLFGSLLLLAFAASFVGLRGMRSDLLTTGGLVDRARRLSFAAWSMAALAWLAALSGTWAVFPWYMDAGGVARALLADPVRSAWQTVGMEMKQHLAWFAPMLATSVAIVAGQQREGIAFRASLRRALLWLLCASFACVAVAGLLGALITRVAPIR
jgi:hypothetical protein